MAYVIARRAALLGTGALLAAPWGALGQGAPPLYGPDGGADARRGGTITVGIANEPPNLDPSTRPATRAPPSRS